MVGPGETPKNINAQGDDNLEAVEGLSRNYAEMLRSIGIYRFVDLGRYDPVTLSKAIQQSLGITIAAETIQKKKWIEQARLLSEKPRNGISQQAAGGKEWDEKSSFMVFFERRCGTDGKEHWRARVYDDRSGEMETTDEIETGQWLDWILARAKLPDPPQPIMWRRPSSGFISHEIFGDFHAGLKRVSVSEYREKTSSGGIQLDIIVSFTLSGLDASKAANRQLPFRLEFYAVDFSLESCQTLASFQKRLVPSKLDYSVRQLIPLPFPERSEIYTILFFLPPVCCMTYHRGPVIRRIKNSGSRGLDNG